MYLSRQTTINYFCTLHASLYQVICLSIWIIVGHPFGTLTENLPCSRYCTRPRHILTNLRLGKGMNPNRWASSFLPNKENVGNYTVVANTVSSVDQRRAFSPMRLNDTRIWAMAERLCSSLASRDLFKYHKSVCHECPPLMNCRIVQMFFSFLEPHPVSKDWGSKLNEEFMIWDSPDSFSFVFKLGAIDVYE